MKSNLTNVRKHTMTVFLFAVALIVTGCADSGSKGNKFEISGTFNSAKRAKISMIDKILNIFSSPAYAVEANEVAKVIVFSGDHNSYDIANVTDGSFSVSVDRDSPVGIVFAGADNSFKGYLTLGSGLDSIPLTAIDDEVPSIDLGNLISAGEVVSPGDNPLGTEIQLTTAELNSLAQIDDFFASTVRNPDADGNGQVDILEDKKLSVFYMYGVEGGTFVGADLSPTTGANAVIAGYRFNFNSNDSQIADTIHFTGPAGSNMNCDSEPLVLSFDDSKMFGSCFISDSVPPVAGNYVITYDDKAAISKTFTYSIPDQSAAADYIVLMVPTVILNGDGTINKITWEYKSGSGETITNPEVFFPSLGIQISGTGTPCEDYPQGGLLYTTNTDLKLDPAEHTLSCQSVLWSNVDHMNMVYNDLYGNHYVVTFRK